VKGQHVPDHFIVLAGRYHDRLEAKIVHRPFQPYAGSSDDWIVSSTADFQKFITNSLSDKELAKLRRGILHTMVVADDKLKKDFKLVGEKLVYTKEEIGDRADILRAIKNKLVNGRPKPASEQEEGERKETSS